MTAPMVRMCGEVLRVKRDDSSLSVRCSLTLDTAVAALNIEGVEIDLSLDGRLKKPESITIKKVNYLPLLSLLLKGTHFS